MPIVNHEKWKKCEESNRDDEYGKACVDVARRTMQLLDRLPFGAPLDTHQLIRQADKDVNAGGITGFMATMVASIIWCVHSQGEDFRKAWNTSYNCSEEQAEGRLVNPAVITI